MTALREYVKRKGSTPQSSGAVHGTSLRKFIYESGSDIEGAISRINAQNKETDKKRRQELILKQQQAYDDEARRLMTVKGIASNAFDIIKGGAKELGKEIVGSTAAVGQDVANVLQPWRKPDDAITMFGREFTTPSARGAKAGTLIRGGEYKKAAGELGMAGLDVVTTFATPFKGLKILGGGNFLKGAVQGGTAAAPIGVGYGVAGSAAEGGTAEEMAVAGARGGATAAFLGLGIGGLLAKLGGKSSGERTDVSADEFGTVADELEGVAGQRLSPEDEAALYEALSTGAEKDDIVSAAKARKAEIDAPKKVADSESKDDIYELIKEKIPDEPTRAKVAKQLEFVKDPDEVTRILDSYDPVKIREDLSVKIADIDSDKKIATMLKGVVPDEDIPTLSRTMKGMQDPEQIGKLLDEFRIREQAKVASDGVDTLKNDAATSKEEVARIEGKEVSAPPKVETIDADFASDIAKNSLKKNPDLIKPRRFDGEAVSMVEAKTGKNTSGVVMNERIVFGKNDAGEIVLEDGSHLLEAYRRQGIEVPIGKVKLTKGLTIDDFSKKTVAEPKKSEPKTEKKSDGGTGESSRMKSVEGTGKTRERGASRSIREKAIAEGMDSFEIPSYKQMETKKILQTKVPEYVDSVSPEEALAVALGRKEAPDGIPPELVLIDLAKKAEAEGDIRVLDMLANESALIDEATTMGQRIQAWSLLSEYSSVKVIGKIKKAFQKRTVEAETKATQKNIDNMRKELDFKIEDARDILNSLMCKT